MPWLELMAEGVDRRPQAAFGTIALDGAPKRLPRHNAKSAHGQIIAAGHHNKQRVGLRLPRAPHPLEVRLTREPVSAIHLLRRGSGSNLKPWPPRPAGSAPPAQAFPV